MERSFTVEFLPFGRTIEVTSKKRIFDIALAPLYRLLRYRADLDALSFAQDAELDVLAKKPANLFGYSTVLVCKNRGPEKPIS